ncbi:hypothetical protein HDV02_000605 [Globomyces sp. JEL0801]|nr:hypothetical protein HDV02_000605 [Globomyces sp. JEL0801]
MTWIKTKLRIEKANELATLYSNFIIPKDHRWKNIHWGYRCELCTRVIHGIRYQCMECITQESFCKECVHDHDSNHALLLVNKPIDLFSDAPLGIKEAQKLSEMDYSWDMSEISIDGTDIVIVNEMNLREILMTYQALVVGAGSLQESNELWPYVADALGSLYESLKEFKQKQNLIVDDDISTSELFFTICKKHFQNITLDDIENEHGLVRKRSSFTQSLYDRVYGKPVSKQTALDQTCIYFKNGTRTLFILRTKSEPKRFYRIELSNSDGRLMESDHIRPQFSMALNALLVGSVDSTPGLLCSD